MNSCSRLQPLLCISSFLCKHGLLLLQLQVEENELSVSKHTLCMRVYWTRLKHTAVYSQKTQETHPCLQRIQLYTPLGDLVDLLGRCSSILAGRLLTLEHLLLLQADNMHNQARCVPTNTHSACFEEELVPQRTAICTLSTHLGSEFCAFGLDFLLQCLKPTALLCNRLLCR